MVNITKSAGGITFSVDDVEPATAALNCRDLGYGLSTLLPGGVRLNSWSDYNSQVVSGVEFHPLIAAVHLAFADHRPLVISPDMIWVTILQGFSQHVRNNAEALRHKLVKHAEGKVEIGIAMDDLFLESPESAWHEAIEMLAFALRHEIGDIFDNLMCDFSTTGPVERTVSQITLLDIYEPFFDYVILAGCGIPSITLEGTSADWLKMRSKLDVLTDFGLDFWLVHVRPILEQFYRASRGDIDLNHWQSIYKQQTDYGVARINGWIAKLIPYLKGRSEKFDDVNPLLLPSSDPRSEDAEVFSSLLPMGTALVPFLLIDKTTEPTRSLAMEIVGGFVGVDQDEETLALRPKLGWAVRQAAIAAYFNYDIPPGWTIEPPLGAKEQLPLLDLLHLRSLRGVDANSLTAFYRDCNGLVFSDTASGVGARIRPLAELVFEHEPIVDESRIWDRKIWVTIADLADGGQAYLCIGDDDPAIWKTAPGCEEKLPAAYRFVQFVRAFVRNEGNVPVLPPMSNEERRKLWFGFAEN